MKTPRSHALLFLRCFNGLGLLTLLLALGTAPARAGDGIPLRSTAVLVADETSGEFLMSRNADVMMPIASLTKLMTALVVVTAKLPMDEIIEITDEDIDREKHTHSRLTVGTRLTRAEMLLLALMSSENRAAMALSRNYPGGRGAFLAQMNAKALSLGMTSSHFADPAGLSMETMSTARDLLRLVSAADAEPAIRTDSTQPEGTVTIGSRSMTFRNTNPMIRNGSDWDIELQKTGFTNEAGRCLVMRASSFNRSYTMIFLDSTGTLTRFADAQRVRRQIELDYRRQLASPTKVATEGHRSS